MSDEKRSANRLAWESSPYLLQHAHNPVDWYPWGDEALQRARSEERPIFLSIGYAACHWCHVMERESFEDERVAAYLNDHFVAIKVDREERPDIDAVYMNAVQALSGSGGWPASVFLTPELQPFFAGTYFPPEARWGMSSFLEVLQAVWSAWSTRRQEVTAAAAEITEQLARFSARTRVGAVNAAVLADRAIPALEREHDAHHGGFGQAPKFPTPSRLFLMLDRAGSGNDRALAMLGATLDGMARGGMWDWVGGGFHRYSVDAEWLVPHFEKMLYDNALLARAYGAAGVVLDAAGWVDVAARTADYLIAEMQGPEGGFYSSTDADSEGEEGRFFTWTAEDLSATLGPADAALAVRFFGLDGEANFEHGRSVLRPLRSISELARTSGSGPEEIGPRLERVRRELYDARARRPRPALDDKRLAGWNGMAIWALAFLGSALDQRRYLDAARRAGAFVLEHMVRPAGLVRSWRDGATGGAETLEDVAWVAAGLVELYQSDGDPRWLRAALALVEARLPHYQAESGAVFEAPDDGERLPVRPRSAFDGATPASVAVLVATLNRIAALTGRDDLAGAARRAVEAEAALLNDAPHACAALLEAALGLERPPTEVVVVGEPGREATRALLRAVRRAPLAVTALAPAPAIPVPADAVDLVPLFSGREQPADDTPIAYVCESGTCRIPTGDPTTLALALGAGRE